MPILEVVQAAKEPVTVEQKRAFARSAVEVFRDVLGTPDGSCVYFSIRWDGKTASPVYWKVNLRKILIPSEK